MLEKRAMMPETSAVVMPARKPPRLMAGSDRPPSRKPSAAPGSRACASASPIRLMRRRIRNTPIEAPPTDSARLATRARRMKPKSANGAIRRSCSTAPSGALAQRRGTPGYVAGAGVLVPGLGHGAGTQQVLGRQDAQRRAGIDQLSRQQETVGEVAAHLVEVVQHAHHGALLGAPALDQRHQVGD